MANATIQQRVVAVRGFYDFLVEEEIRERNPVRRGADRAEATALLTGLAAHLRIRLRTDGELTRLWLAPPSTEFPRAANFGYSGAGSSERRLCTTTGNADLRATETEL